MNQTKDNNAFTVEQMYEQLGKMIENGQGENRLVIRYDPGYTTMGGAPSLALGPVHAGFDWDRGKAFVTTEKPVGVVDAVLQKKLRRMENHQLHLLRLLRDNSGKLSSDEKIKKSLEWVENAILTKDDEEEKPTMRRRLK